MSLIYNWGLKLKKRCKLWFSYSQKLRDCKKKRDYKWKHKMHWRKKIGKQQKDKDLRRSKMIMLKNLDNWANSSSKNKTLIKIYTMYKITTGSRSLKLKLNNNVINFLVKRLFISILEKEIYLKKRLPKSSMNNK